MLMDKGRMVDGTEHMIKVNIGCGPVGHKDWINIDYGILALLHRFKVIEKAISIFGLWPDGCSGKWPPNLLFHDCRVGLPFDDTSVDYVYTSHFLEHLRKYEAVKLLRHIYRCLKNDGVLRIVVPDLDRIVNNYVKNDCGHEKVTELNKHFYSMPGADSETPVSILNGVMRRFMRPHQWHYNYCYLKERLIDAGFAKNKIVKVEFQKGITPNIDALDAHPEISLFVEAVK